MSLPPSPATPYPGAAVAAPAATPAPVPAQQLAYVSPGVEAVVLTPRATEMLRQTRPWVLFIGIVLLVIGALAVVGAAVGAAVVATQQGPTDAIFFVAYLVVGLIYAFPGLYLWRYAARIRGVVNLRSSEHLEAALEAQKSFWRLVGILFALVIGLYFLLILFAVVGLAVPRFMR